MAASDDKRPSSDERSKRPRIKGRLLKDEEIPPDVKRIFDLFKEGADTPDQIKRMLNDTDSSTN